MLLTNLDLKIRRCRLIYIKTVGAVDVVTYSLSLMPSFLFSIPFSLFPSADLI